MGMVVVLLWAANLICNCICICRYMYVIVYLQYSCNLKSSGWPNWQTRWLFYFVVFVFICTYICMCCEHDFFVFVFISACIWYTVYTVYRICSIRAILRVPACQIGKLGGCSTSGCEHVGSSRISSILAAVVQALHWDNNKNTAKWVDSRWLYLHGGYLLQFHENWWGWLL